MPSHFYVYILYAKSIDRFYIGQTENLMDRQQWHLNKLFRRNFTVQADDWELFFAIECDTRKQAVNIEAHIKKMKSSKYIRNLTIYPEIAKKLVEKYNS